jgi:hypothetical protein
MLLDKRAAYVSCIEGWLPSQHSSNDREAEQGAQRRDNHSIALVNL